MQVLDCDVEEPNADILLRPEITDRETVSILVPSQPRAVPALQALRPPVVAAIAVGKAVITFRPVLGLRSLRIRLPHRASASAATHRRSRARDPDAISFHGGRLDVGHQRSGPVTAATKRARDEAAVTIIDAPPGTACPMQEAVDGSDFCVLVTEPTPFGLANLREAVATCRRMDVSCGVVINRDRDGYGDLNEWLATEDLPVLLRVPERRKIAEAYSRGETLLSASDEWLDELTDLYQQIAGLCAPSGKER